MHFFTASLLAAFTLISSTFAAAVQRRGSTGSQLAVYYGQGGDQATLSTFCNDDTIDIIPIGFVTALPGNPGSVDGHPALNFGNQCWAGGRWVSEEGNETQMFADCTSMIPSIQYCQSKGKKILLSIGGVTQVYFKDDQTGSDFADYMWGAFGPYKSTWKGPRPFGNDIVLDGFDFDIETTSAPVPVDTGIAAAAGRFRTIWGSNQRLLTAAPQCPVPDTHIKDVLNKVSFDALFIQFYNTKYCSARAYFDKTFAESGRTASFSFPAWVDWLAANSVNKNIKAFIGLPAAPEAAGASGSYYLTPDEVNEIVRVHKKKYPVNFGGVMLWEMTYSAGNTDSKGRSYAQQVRYEMDNPKGSTSSTTTKATTTTSTSSTTKSTAAPTSSSSSSTTKSTTTESTTTKSTTTASTTTKSTTTESTTTKSTTTASTTTKSTTTESTTTKSTTTPSVTSSSTTVSTTKSTTSSSAASSSSTTKSTTTESTTTESTTTKSTTTKSSASPSSTTASTTKSTTTSYSVSSSSTTTKSLTTSSTTTKAISSSSSSTTKATTSSSSASTTKGATLSTTSGKSSSTTTTSGKAPSTSTTSGKAPSSTTTSGKAPSTTTSSGKTSNTSTLSSKTSSTTTTSNKVSGILTSSTKTSLTTKRTTYSLSSATLPFPSSTTESTTHSLSSATLPFPSTTTTSTRSKNAYTTKEHSNSWETWSSTIPKGGSSGTWESWKSSKTTEDWKVWPTSSTKSRNPWDPWPSSKTTTTSTDWKVWPTTTPAPVDPWKQWPNSDVTVTVITTSYVDVCPTGYTTIPYTTTVTLKITPPAGSKPTGHPSSPHAWTWPIKSDGCPSGFFTTTTVCATGCGKGPKTVTLTLPTPAGVLTATVVPLSPEEASTWAGAPVAHIKPTDGGNKWVDTADPSAKPTWVDASIPVEPSSTASASWNTWANVPDATSSWTNVPGVKTPAAVSGTGIDVDTSASASAWKNLPSGPVKEWHGAASSVKASGAVTVVAAVVALFVL